MKKTIALLSLILVACNAPDPLRVGGPIPPPGIAKCNVSADFTGDCRVATPLTFVGAGPTISSLNYGLFGDGGDGSPTFDGTTTITLNGTSFVPSSNTYTLTRDLFLDSPICNSGVTIKTAGFGVWVRTDFIGPASGTCRIADDGQDAVTTTRGSGRDNGFNEGGPGRLRGGQQGGAAGCNNAFGSNGTSAVIGDCRKLPGVGGVGGSPNPGGNGGGGGAAPTSTCSSRPLSGAEGLMGDINIALSGHGELQTWTFGGASGGSGGGSNGLGSGCGGAGGAGGGYMTISTKHVTNPSHVTIGAKGGAGGIASGQSGGNSSGGGAGGGGGYVVLVIGSGTQPTFDIAGGTGGAGAGGSGTSGANGTSGQTFIFVTGI